MVTSRAILQSLVIAMTIIASVIAEKSPATLEFKIANLNGALSNKNMMTEVNVAVTPSSIHPQQPESKIKSLMNPDLTGERDMLMALDTSTSVREFEQLGPMGFRHRFFLPHFHGGYYGWRYPLAYWQTYGYRLYGSTCLFGRIIGGFFYC